MNPRPLCLVQGDRDYPAQDDRQHQAAKKGKLFTYSQEVRAYRAP